ncbi:MAG: hypothetical protein PHO37_10860 [Kiritimatiellae bacterium]|nr:hypothetical protein [Kiritimatiellia bacterium]
MKSYSTSRVKGELAVGGFVGCLGYISAEHCFSSGLVQGQDYAGGFAGKVYGADIKSCFTSSEVRGAQKTGGFAANISNSSVTDCYAAGAAIGGDAGGFVAVFANSSVIACFWDVEVSGVSISAAAIGTNTIAMQDDTTFIDAGWDITNVWYMDSYPKLRAHADSSRQRFQLWAFDAGAPLGSRGQQDCPAGDNIANLLKYAVGLEPLTFCSTTDLMLPRIDEAEGKFTVTYQRSKDTSGVALYPTWTASLRAPNWQGSGLALRKLSEEASTELWEASLSVAGRSSAFIRLNADLIEEE